MALYMQQSPRDQCFGQAELTTYTCLVLGLNVPLSYFLLHTTHTSILAFALPPPEIDMYCEPAQPSATPYSAKGCFVGSMAPQMFLDRFLCVSNNFKVTQRADFSNVPTGSSVQEMGGSLVSTHPLLVRL